ncbi:MAG: hypothetical protein ACXWR1_01700 [Bdellovibrionota bacterium]
MTVQKKGAELAKLFHDLRAPLARAQTYSKLIEGASPAEMGELMPQLRKALDDLDALLRSAEEDS